MAIVDDLEFRMVVNHGHFFKLVLERRKERVAFNGSLDDREIQVRAPGKSLGVYLSAAADKNVTRKFRRIELVERVENQNVGGPFLVQKREPQLIFLLDLVADVGATTPLLVLAEDFRVPSDHLPRMMREDQVGPVRQRFAQTFKRLSPHDDDISQGLFLEPLEVLRQMPRDLAGRADHTVQGHGGDGFEIFHGAQSSRAEEWRSGKQSNEWRILVRHANFSSENELGQQRGHPLTGGRRFVNDHASARVIVGEFIPVDRNLDRRGLAFEEKFALDRIVSRIDSQVQHTSVRRNEVLESSFNQGRAGGILFLSQPFSGLFKRPLHGK